jgi:hypothetical protein
LQLAVEMSRGEEYDAVFAATIAAAAYAIAAREEKLATEKKPIPIDGASPVLTPVRAESIKKPAGGSKISRWFSGKEPLEDGDGPGNVNMTKVTPFIVTFSVAQHATLL